VGILADDPAMLVLVADVHRARLMDVDPFGQFPRMCCKNDSVCEPNRSPIGPVSIIQFFNPRVSRMK
jgi:hypothetical protein